MPDEETQREQVYELLTEAQAFIDVAADWLLSAQGPDLTKAECEEVWLPVQQARRKLDQVRDQVRQTKAGEDDVVEWQEGDEDGK